MTLVPYYKLMFKGKNNMFFCKIKLLIKNNVARKELFLHKTFSYGSPLLSYNCY